MPSNKPLLQAATRSLASRPNATESSRKSRKLPHQDQALRIAQVSEPKPVAANRQPDNLQRLSIVMTRTGYSRASLYRMAIKGLFPKPVQLGGRAIAWRESEVDKWIAERTTVSWRDAPGTDSPAA
jgi:prophage regulatory protein